MAKHALQATDFAQTQVIEHLSNVHLFMEPICVCVNRQFSQLHPMHQILKYHCRGLIGTNKLGYPFLVAPGKGTLDKLLTVGAEGAFQMILRAYQNFDWERTDFLDNIKVSKGKFTLYKIKQIIVSLLQSLFSYLEKTKREAWGQAQLRQYTLFQNGRHLDILLFSFKLDLHASFKAKYSFEFTLKIRLSSIGCTV